MEKFGLRAFLREMCTFDRADFVVIGVIFTITIIYLIGQDILR